MERSIDRLKLVKRNNRAQLALAVHRQPSVSRADLARITGLSITCVCNLIDEMLSEHQLKEVGSALGPRGRPVALYDIDPDGPPVAGIWLTPESSQIAVADAAGKVLARRIVNYGPQDDTSETVIPAVAQTVKRCVEAAGKELSSLRGVGVAVSGYVDQKLGTMDGWRALGRNERVPVAPMLEKMLGVPVIIENDVRAGALAQQWFSNEAQDGGTLYITVGDGIGGAYVLDGKVVRGAHDMALVLEHVCVDPNGPMCFCGNQGCLGTFSTDTALIKKIWPDAVESSWRMPHDERIKLVKKAIELAQSGDTTAYAALTDGMIGHLGLALANLVNILDVRTVFVGGPCVDVAPDLIIDNIRQEVMRRVDPRARAVEIKARMDFEEFLLNGSLGLVLWEPFRVLHEDNAGTRVTTASKSRAVPRVPTRELERP
ncbi:MAG: ROK family protein [Armatimonadota bacterium]|nr:ROK family protein [bacterium]